MDNGITATMDAELVKELAKLREENTCLRATCLALRMHQAVMQDDANLGKAVRSIPAGYVLDHSMSARVTGGPNIDKWAIHPYCYARAKWYPTPDEATLAGEPFP